MNPNRLLLFPLSSPTLSADVDGKASPAFTVPDANALLIPFPGVLFAARVFTDCFVLFRPVILFFFFSFFNFAGSNCFN